MPEGPEIRREADRIGKALVGQRLSKVWFAFDQLQPWSDTLQRRTVRAVEPRGKALLIRIGGGINIYSHNQLYGRWYVMPAGRNPKTNRQLRLALHTARHGALLYSASDIDVLADDELADHPFLARLGPDVLDSTVTAEDVRSRLLARAFRRRSLGALLLDQGFVCGLGNYLRSEILFVSGLVPELRPMDLGEFQLDTLATAILTMARRAYRTRGVTNDPDEVRRLKADGQTRSEYRHFVFARADRSCRHCGERIEKVESAGRRLYRCAVCQPG